MISCGIRFQHLLAEVGDLGTETREPELSTLFVVSNAAKFVGSGD